jgi:hypothetical protein
LLISIPAQGGTYEASFRKEFNIAFQNDMLGSSSGGVIKVNSNQVAAPTSSFPVVEDQNITAAAIDQTIQGIMYTFNHWTDGTNNYSGRNQTFTPADRTSFTAVFDAQPYYVTNLRRTSAVGSYVRLEWDEHPHPNVSRYDIYREVRSLPSYTIIGGPEYRGYKNRGSTSYTDIEYRTAATGSGTYDLRYDVRPYFSLNGTSAPVRYSSFGSADPGISPESHDMQLIALPTTTEVSNYPNPFNPSTTIKYQIAEPSFVRIAVYDIMGRKIKELLNESKPAGYYEVVWNGSSENERSTSTGIYFLYFTAQVDGKKELFSKTIKLLLSK